MKPRSIALQGSLILLPIMLSLALSALLVLAVGHNPVEAFTRVWEGAFSSTQRLAGVFNFWIPLTLASMGLAVTFTAGLWNIGVEGQMILGAIFASGVALYAPLPMILRVPLACIMAIVGGGLWGLLVGVLKTRLGVHEIFGGVALNAIANVLTIFLVANLWSPEGGNAVDTGPFPDAGRMPSFSGDFPASVTMIVLTIVLAGVVVYALRGTRWGLQLKATGKNARSALLLGVATERVALSAFAVCGALAGLGGAYVVLFTRGTLRPLVTGGIGFLGLLVVLVVSIRALWVPFITFAFAAILSGSTRLRITMRLDSSLAGVLQGMLVLLVLLSNGLRARFAAPGDDAEATDTPTTTSAPVSTGASYE